MQSSRLPWVLLAALLLLAPAPASAQPVPPSQCTGLKYKAVGVYAGKLLACRAKERAKGIESFQACLDKNYPKLLAAFERAERKGDCVTEGDGDFLESEITQLIQSVNARLDRVTRVCCEAEFGQCFYAADAGDCAGNSAVAGVFGDVCHADGTCGAPPAAPGACCEGPGYGSDISCYQGSGFDADTCENLAGGAYTPNATCSPVDGCVAAP